MGYHSVSKRKAIAAIIALLAIIAVPTALAVAGDDPPDDEYVPSDLTPYVLSDPLTETLHQLGHTTGVDPKPSGDVWPPDGIEDPTGEAGKTSQPGEEAELEPPAPKFPNLTQEEAEKEFDPADDPTKEVVKCPDDRVLIVEKVPVPAGAPQPPPPEGDYEQFDICNPPDGP